MITFLQVIMVNSTYRALIEMISELLGYHRPKVQSALNFTINHISLLVSLTSLTNKEEKDIGDPLVP